MFSETKKRPDYIAVVGLGYVGLPLALAFSQVARVIGFDINQSKVNLYKEGIDPTNEVGDEAIRNCQIKFTSDPQDLRAAAFIVVAVPTPVDKHNNPDLRPLEEASKLVGGNMRRGAVVVYESTVFPGVTEDICVPILERESGFKCGTDFKVGYSPERINPGDKVHRLENIIKIVSGMDEEALDYIADVYGLVVKAGVYRASSIKVAEAAKVIENAQRDINIAFVNELAVIFNKMGINTLDVLEAAGTKWNFLNFRPGLVGGHCIGVDPYYLAYKAQELGYHPEVILAGRRINDHMGKYVAENLIKQLIRTGSSVRDAKVLIMGLTFKEDVPDIRNTKVIDIIRELEEYGVNVLVCDPYADQEQVYHEYGLSLSQFDQVPQVDAVVIAVSHKEYTSLPLNEIRNKLIPDRGVLFDLKGIYAKQGAEKHGFVYWSL